MVWSSMNLMKTFVLLRGGDAGLDKGFSEGDLAGFGGATVEGELLGKDCSRRDCQRMFGGVLIMLKRANLKMGARFMASGVCGSLVSLL